MARGEGTYLGEVPEAGAEGRIGELYADIRRTLGVSFVALIYRALATIPGVLERVWSELAPNLGSGYARAGATNLAQVALCLRVCPISASALAGVRLDGQLAAVTLSSYRRANSANIIALMALRYGVDAQPFVYTPAPDNAQPAVAAPILPMVNLQEVPVSSRRLLEKISAPITGGDPPVIVPSLLRHFAHDRCLLELLWTALEPSLLADDFGLAAEAILSKARDVARGLPYRVTPLDDEPGRVLIGRFTPTIPRMLITGALLEVALKEKLGQ